MQPGLALPPAQIGAKLAALGLVVTADLLAVIVMMKTNYKKTHMIMYPN